ncbi:Rix1 complex component involved in 60S ribosome maturation family protein [Leishmania donovani]|uniref:Rix1 complex component involved in 60S ribosome maturation family protein n=1 Tax=Leishmania donovani TaxID=5661 RepID=A0A504XZ07_LEIDO|nr:Rix1 complex component involved in 60S ribosome maturation family protein [Leishmania donovani]
MSVIGQAMAQMKTSMEAVHREDSDDGSPSGTGRTAMEDNASSNSSLLFLHSKKPKGDSAFTTRRQKVGRKKLAPATATRAEVHARTLRLTTSTAMSAAMAAPYVKDPAAHPASSETTSAGMKDSESKSKRLIIAVQSFSELLSATHHYKAAQRSSAFATLTRLLRIQREKDNAAGAGAARHSGGAASNVFEEYMRYSASTNATADAAGVPFSSGAPPTCLSSLSPLERLKSFAAALEAVTDTDDDVRREALQALQVLVDYQWISCERDGSVAPTPSSFLEPTSTRKAADLERCNARLLSMQDGDGGRSGSAEVPVAISASTSTSSTSVDRVQTILQAVHVALTHALKPVRLSGVELLSLLLRVAPPSLVRAAARAVCKHQTSYYATPAATATSAAGTATTAALEAAQERAATLLEEEEVWMLTLVRRVSSLVLRTKHVPVLPALLGVFLGESGFGASGATAEDSITAELLRTPPLLGGVVASHVMSASGASDAVDGSSGGALWRYPELVNSFFDDVAPQWANNWKELMELRLALLRQDDKLAMASALARSFAIVLVFLKRQQQQGLSSRAGRSGSVNFFSRKRMHYIKALFIEKMPVTMHELLLMPSAGASVASSTTAPTAAATAPPKAMKARLELGLALVMVCVPLAGTEEGWHLMRDYFSIVFSLPRATPPPPEPFRFPSVALLEMSVRLFAQAIRLYPCVAPQFQVAGDTAAVPPGRNTGLGDFSVPLVSCSDAKCDGPRRAKRDRGDAAGPAVSSQATPSFHQHSTVAERLLTFLPAVLTTIIKHLVPRSDSLNSGAGDAASDDMALVRVLLCAATILERFAALPEDLFRRGGAVRRKGHGGKTDGGCGDAATTAQRLEEGFGLVPRLLFALREQSQMRQRKPDAVKRARAEDEDDGDNHVGDAPAQTDDSAATPVVTRTGVLLSYNGIVDVLVHRFLRVLWFLSSSGHPLLHDRRTTSTGKAASSPASTSVSPSAPLAALLTKSIKFLFGSAGVSGVLQRCTTPTVLLAHSTLFYLGGGGGSASSPIALVGSADAVSVAAAETERTPMAEAVERWADVLGVIGALRARVHMDA